MTSENREDLEIIPSARVAFYFLMRNALGSAPTGELLKALSSDGGRAVIALAGNNNSANAAVSAYFSALDKLLAHCQENPSETLEAMRDDYTALFVGPAKLAAQPWESYYRDSEGALFSKHTLSVRDAYRTHGFVSSGYPNEPDDHLAYELDFMRHLAQQTFRKLQEDTDIDRLVAAQSSFLKNHLLQWIDEYAEDMEKTDRACLYPFLVNVLQLTLNRDNHFLDSLLETNV